MPVRIFHIEFAQNQYSGKRPLLIFTLIKRYPSVYEQTAMCTRPKRFRCHHCCDFFESFEKPRVRCRRLDRERIIQDTMLHHHARCLSKCVPIHTDRRKKPSASERLCNRSRAERSELTLHTCAHSKLHGVHPPNGERETSFEGHS